MFKRFLQDWTKGALRYSLKVLLLSSRYQNQLTLFSFFFAYFAKLHFKLYFLISFHTANSRNTGSLLHQKRCRKEHFQHLYCDQDVTSVQVKRHKNWCERSVNRDCVCVCETHTESRAACIDPLQCNVI